MVIAATGAMGERALGEEDRQCMAGVMGALVCVWWLR